MAEMCFTVIYMILPYCVLGEAPTSIAIDTTTVCCTIILEPAVLLLLYVRPTRERVVIVRECDVERQRSDSAQTTPRLTYFSLHTIAVFFSPIRSSQHGALKVTAGRSGRRLLSCSTGSIFLVCVHKGRTDLGGACRSLLCSCVHFFFAPRNTGRSFVKFRTLTIVPPTCVEPASF